MLLQLAKDQRHDCELILTKDSVDGGGVAFVIRNNTFRYVSQLCTQSVVRFRDSEMVEHCLRMGPQDVGDCGRSFTATCDTIPAGFPYVGYFVPCVVDGAA